MKKGITVLMAVVCFVFSCRAMTAEAAGTPNYCSNCGAALVSRGEHISHWTTTHMAFTGYYVGNQPIYQECTITHSVDRSALVCPNGCGVAWQEDKETQTHSSQYCK